jgi:hypothetical protein
VKCARSTGSKLLKELQAEINAAWHKHEQRLQRKAILTLEQWRERMMVPFLESEMNNGQPVTPSNMIKAGEVLAQHIGAIKSKEVNMTFDFSGFDTAVALRFGKGADSGDV